MTFCNISQSVAIATDSSELHLVHSGAGSLIRYVKTPSIINHMAISNKAVVVTSLDGSIAIYDPQTAMRRAELGTANKAHQNGVRGLQVSGNNILTIGYGTRSACLQQDFDSL